MYNIIPELKKQNKTKKPHVADITRWCSRRLGVGMEKVFMYKKLWILSHLKLCDGCLLPSASRVSSMTVCYCTEHKCVGQKACIGSLCIIRSINWMAFLFCNPYDGLRPVPVKSSFSVWRGRWHPTQIPELSIWPHILSRPVLPENGRWFPPSPTQGEGLGSRKKNLYFLS